tara:strand:- start:1248 stop:2252 length:1005 start_codon:yes stop_codon:yes gene_type:complete
MRLFLKVPELTLLIVLSLACYFAIGVIEPIADGEFFSLHSILSLTLASFVLSVAIAIIAVIAGIGGGVIFTPIVLGFTSLDSLVVRATGLVVAMFSGLISAAPLLKQGLVDIRLVYICALPTVIGGLLGALMAFQLASVMGPGSDAFVRVLLGLLLLGVAVLFITGGGRHDYPKASRLTGLARLFSLDMSYYEESVQTQVRYSVKRLGLAICLFIGVGFIGGFFGLGGGWAMVPVLNLVMAVPLKAAVASSGVLLALGNAAAIWPYMLYGAMVPILVAPWMLGQVIGGIVGAHILAKVKVVVVRRLMILLLCLTSVKLIYRGLQDLDYIGRVIS